MVVRIIFFLNSANLICRGTDISKYLIESLGIRDNESRLYIQLFVWRSRLKCTFWYYYTNEPAHGETHNNTCATSKDSDQPVHCMCRLQLQDYPKRNKYNPLPYWVDALADLSLCWSHSVSCASSYLIQRVGVLYFPKVFGYHNSWPCLFLQSIRKQSISLLVLDYC